MNNNNRYEDSKSLSDISNDSPQKEGNDMSEHAKKEQSYKGLSLSAKKLKEITVSPKVKDGKVFRKRPNHREMADIKMIDTLLNANKGIKYIADKLEKSSKFRAKDWTPTRVLYLIRKHKLGNLAKTSDLFKILNKITKEKHIEKKVIEEGQRLVHTKHAHDTRQKENKKKRMDVDAKMDVESDVDSDDDVPKPRKKDSIDI